MHGSLARQLGDRTVVIEPGHRREARRVEVLGVALGDESVGVRRVPHDEDLDVAAGATGEGLALGLEDATVGAEQIGALHALLARHGADEQGDVGIAEGGVGIVGLDHAGKEGEGAVLQLHADAIEGAKCGRDLEHLQDDGLVRAPASSRWRCGTGASSRSARQHR